MLANLFTSVPKSNAVKDKEVSYKPDDPDEKYDTDSYEADWNREKDLFHFTRGRFVYDEPEQLSRRYVQFNMNKLAEIVATAIDATRCEKVEKCPDGLCNKAYIFTMDDGKEVVGKVPNPNAGTSHYTTASEVATMDFVSCVAKYVC